MCGFIVINCFGLKQNPLIVNVIGVNQVDSRVQSLSGLYDGPQPSDLCDMLEGEQFFAGFERGLDVSTGLKSSLFLLFCLLCNPMSACRGSPRNM